MHIYFMGICGTAMGNAALLFRELGHHVSGADAGTYPPMSNVLADAGIEILPGFDPRRLRDLRPDLVVIGNAQSRGNPEIEWLLDERTLQWISLPQLLGDHVLRDRHSIVVTGTHGKTTTTSLTAYLLDNNGSSCGYLIGGVSRDLASSARIGNPQSPFVIEGDEYDSAFFDKRSKFLHYHPRVLIINNIEFDHGDIFRDEEDILRSFRHGTRIVPQSGHILVNGDDLRIRSLLPIPWTHVHTVGVDPNNDLQICDFRDDENGSRFAMRWQGALWGSVQWKLSGLFNARNAAMAALAAGMTLFPNSPSKLSLQRLNAFQGVRRRLELRAQRPGLRLFEDFGHHPTAVRGTLDALRCRFPNDRIIACFEPRSNTACRSFFQNAFLEALDAADVALIAPVHRAESIPDADRLDVERLSDALKQRGRVARAFHSFEDLKQELMQIGADGTTSSPQTICVFSNGSFGGILDSLITQINGASKTS